MNKHIEQLHPDDVEHIKSVLGKANAPEPN